MAGTTPNRAYPYPTSGDPFDIPGDIQRLAEALDTDLQLLEDSITQRPFAKVSWRFTAKQTFVPDQVTECQYNYVDYDPLGISSLGTRPTRLTPNSPGLWGVWGMFECPSADADLFDLNLRNNGADLVRTGQHVNDPTSTAGQAMTVFGMAFMDGVDDYFTMTFQPLDGTENFKTNNIHLACFRLTAA